MRVLIIEDNRDLCYSMKTGLEKLGFYIDAAFDAETGEEKAYVNEYDVILLDLNLPDKDGLEILKDFRKSNNNTPVIIVSARDDIEQRTVGLDLGADDYITKPFQISEVRARIQAVIRRFQGRTTPTIKIDGLEIEPAKRVATFNGKIIPLKAKEFDILEYLSMKFPTVVSSEELSEHVYDENFDPFSSVLRVHITRLRKKLTDASGYEMLQTMRGKGYYLCENQK
ncbi:DNA-binding response regulator, OmpR family, contains REC and winged-helix (wHTH) domain [Clostridium amylolyticum]|uniref:Stage 0 sporulation protein A homolog n=1 Tax=Clostridium amylolyticum TaxID=1121298 RepID=A0A1M6H8I7_9CLOT|nr:response regulator transcription factor [Clostridium amylolyticum]SHJ18510.1 DNA-binding response regulator, OmpR family, contains REC and winged-helix (wHTH) domain [Clostridium amylolyticum]